MQGIANNLVIKIINLYQRFVSPHKGYCCAHSAYHGRSSCSSWGIRVIEKHGVGMFFPLMKRRFKACQMAYEKLTEEKKNKENGGGEVSDCPCLTAEAAAYCIAAAPCYWS